MSGSTSLEHLSEAQIKNLKAGSRRALEERLRVLEEVDKQIWQAVNVLTEVLSVDPRAEVAEEDVAGKETIRDEKGGVCDGDGLSEKKAGKMPIRRWEGENIEVELRTGEGEKDEEEEEMVREIENL